MEKRFDVTGIGVSVFDVIMVIGQMPQEEAVVRARQRAAGIGGGIAVACATAGALGGRVRFADRLGYDPLSESIIASLEAASVDVSCLQRSEQDRASVATIWVQEASGSRTIVFSPGPESHDLVWSESLAESVASSRILHINGRHLSACLQAIHVAREYDVQVSFDGGAHRYRPEVLPLVCASNILIVSEHFALSHWRASTSSTGAIAPAELTAFLLAEFECRLVGVTCGERGSWLAVRGGQPWHQEAVAVDAVRDTTGCGDTYHGAFLLAVAKGLSPVECGRMAALVAAENAACLGAFGFDAATVRDRLWREYPQLR